MERGAWVGYEKRRSWKWNLQWACILWLNEMRLLARVNNGVPEFLFFATRRRMQKIQAIRRPVKKDEELSITWSTLYVTFWSHVLMCAGAWFMARNWSCCLCSDGNLKVVLFWKSGKRFFWGAFLNHKSECWIRVLAERHLLSTDELPFQYRREQKKKLKERAKKGD